MVNGAPRQTHNRGGERAAQLPSACGTLIPLSARGAPGGPQGQRGVGGRQLGLTQSPERGHSGSRGLSLPPHHPFLPTIHFQFCNLPAASWSLGGLRRGCPEHPLPLGMPCPQFPRESPEMQAPWGDLDSPPGFSNWNEGPLENTGLQAHLPGAAVGLRGNQPPTEGSTDVLQDCGKGACIYRIT